MGRDFKQVALVLGSGGLKCAAAMGAFKVLAREGIQVNMLVGCSGGGIYAAMMALGYSDAEIQDITCRGWTKKNLSQYRYRPFVNQLLPQGLRSDHAFSVLDDRPFLNVMGEVLGGRTFADARIPLYLVATDMETGEKVVLEEGSVLDAVRASMSIPIFFEPWRIGGRVLADGALTDPLPIDVAIREGADVILAMGFPQPYDVNLVSLGSVANKTINTMVNHLLVSTFAFYNAVHHTEIIPIMPDFSREIALTDTHLLPHIVEEGERATEEQMPYVRRLLEAV